MFVFNSIFKSSGLLVLAAALSLSSLSCGESGAQISLKVSVRDGVELPAFSAVKVIVRSDDCQLRVYQTASDQSGNWLPTVVSPNQQFYIDVWACNPQLDDGGQPRFCQTADIVGRGCTTIQEVAPSSEIVEQLVELVDIDHPAYASCPPDANQFARSQVEACEDVANSNEN